MKRASASRSPVLFFDALESRILLSGDDHPDWADFPAATSLQLAPVIGDAPWFRMDATGVLETPEDTDVFQFIPPEDAWYGFVLVLSGEANPPWTSATGEVRDSSGNQVFSLIENAGIAGTTWGPGSFQYPEAHLEKGQSYYIGVRSGDDDGPKDPLPTGPYRIFAAIWAPEDGGKVGGGDDDGTQGGGGDDNGNGGWDGDGDWGGDDWGNWEDNGGGGGHPEVPPLLVNDDQVGGDVFGMAGPVGQDPFAGRGVRGGSIEQAGDTDLFRFRVTADGPVHVRLGATAGQLSAGVRIFDDHLNEIAYDNAGAPGALADVTFSGRPGLYYARVEPADSGTGSYSLQVETTPAEYTLFYPEGYRSPDIDERVILTNPGTAPAHYTLTARYEVGARDQVVAEGVIAPGAGALIRLSDPSHPEAPGVRGSTPYALELRSDGLLAATLRHDDFGATTGSPFTSQTSRDWTFAEARSLPAEGEDFLVLYNPSGEKATVKVTLYDEDGVVTSFSRRLDGMRRGGVNFATDPAVPAGRRFGVRIESDVAIVAAMSSYGVSDGFAMLGATGGRVEGVIPSIAVAEHEADSRVTVLNTGDTVATVRFSVSAVNSGGSEQVRLITVPAFGVASIAMDDFGYQPGQVVGVRFSSALPVTVAGYQPGSPGGSAGASSGLAWSSADFIGGRWGPDSSAGFLSLYNPSADAASVTVTLRFSNGTKVVRHVGVGAGGFRRVDLASELSLPEGVRGVGFSMRLDSSTPVVASLAMPNGEGLGEWSALLEPIGLVTPIERF